MRIASRRAAAFRPRLEALETRLALSTLLPEPPLIVNTDPAGSAQSIPFAPPPVAAAADNGDGFVVAWISADVEGATVLARRFNRFGDALTDDLVVDLGIQPAGTYPHVAVAMDGSGNFVVTYDVLLDSESGLTGVFARRYDSAGNTLDSSPFQVNSGFGVSDPSVAVDQLGRFVVAYTETDESGSAVVFQAGLIAGSQPLSGGPKVVDSVAAQTGTTFASPRVAADAAGDFVVAYEADQGFGAPTSTVSVSVFDPTGAHLGPAFVVSSGKAATHPDVSFARNGAAFVATWIDATATPVVEARRFDNVFGVLDPIVTVSGTGETPGTAPYDGPRVAVLTDGEFSVLWGAHRAPSGETDPAPVGDVLVRTFDVNDMALGSAVRLNPLRNAAGPVALAASPDGVVAAYSAARDVSLTANGFSATSTQFDILAVLFDPPTNPFDGLAFSSSASEDDSQLAIALLAGRGPEAGPSPVELPRPEVPRPQRSDLPEDRRRFPPLAAGLQIVGGTNAVGEISGRLFADSDGSGEYHDNKPGLPGRVVYLDLNQNGVLDEGEPAAVTDERGFYVFSGLSMRSYYVRQLLTGDEVQTQPPDNEAYEVRLSPARPSMTTRDFGTTIVRRRAGPPKAVPPAAVPPPPTVPSSGGAGESEEGGD